MLNEQRNSIILSIQETHSIAKRQSHAADQLGKRLGRMKHLKQIAWRNIHRGTEMKCMHWQRAR